MVQNRGCGRGQRRGLPSRRAFLGACAAAGGLGALASCAVGLRSRTRPHFITRGVVLLPDDLVLTNWPDRAFETGMTTIALHHDTAPLQVARFIESPEGVEFLGHCRELDLALEFELTAMNALLPRALFERDPTLFRMDDDGDRTPEGNFCTHASEAMAIVAQNARELARRLRPTTHRYFLCPDTALPWCRCRRCAELTDSDQALLLANRLLAVLRAEDPLARLAYRAHARTEPVPLQIKPDPGIFLEFSPAGRDYAIPVARGKVEFQRRLTDLFSENLELFGRETSQVLEYWLDIPTRSPSVDPPDKVPFDLDLVSADLAFYGGNGIRRIATYARRFDAQYVSRWGDSPADEFGELLATWRPAREKG